MRSIHRFLPALAAALLLASACDSTPTANASTQPQVHAGAPRANTIDTYGEFETLQVTGDFSVAGSVDMGQTATGALSIGSGYVEVGGAPFGMRQGALLWAQPASAVPASTEGARLFFDSATRKLSVRLPVADGGGVVALH